MNFNKDDVERITEGVLKRLSLKIEQISSYDPNTRTILLMYENEEIDRISFGVVQKDEYEG